MSRHLGSRQSGPSRGNTKTLLGDGIALIDPLKVVPSSAAQAYFKQFPLPNDMSAGDGLNTSGFRFNSPVHSGDNAFISRIDVQLTNNQSLFWRGKIAASSRNNLKEFPSESSRNTARSTDQSAGFAFGYTSVINSNLSMKWAEQIQTTRSNTFVSLRFKRFRILCWFCATLTAASFLAPLYRQWLLYAAAALSISAIKRQTRGC